MLSAVDRRDLRWLEIGHYVFAGIALLWTVFAWLFFVRMGAVMKVQPTPQAAAVNDFMEGAMFAGVLFQASFIFTLGLVGILVRQRIGYWACLFLSAWNLLLMPFGTAAAIVTFLLLRRRGVECAFNLGETMSAEDTVVPSPQVPTPAIDPPRAASDLRLLPALHYALAGLTFLIGALPILHVAAGLAMIVKPDFPANIKDGDRQLIGSLFLGLGLVSVGMLWVVAAAVAAAGRFIGQRRRYTFCLVVSAVNCAFFPIGTALGAYTLIVLNRDYVKAAFLQPPAPA